ncbi:MAG TPA: RNA polymerase sigma-54 factor [Epsilonproteobacteria bacterium]|nr:RNA polymerase sigma-54 factor [Campylobacterota bacterium]
MALKQHINLKQKQIPRLSMQTWIPLLQCSLSDLDKHIQVIANENPCLEVSSGFEVSEGSSRDTHSTFMEYQNRVSNASSDEIEWMSISAQSLYEKLDEQITAPLFPTPISQKIAKQIVMHISDEGYFEGEIETIAQECNTSPSQAESVRQRFAYLLPYGVGAKDYKESFLFQLNEFELDDDLSLLLSAMIVQFEALQKFLTHPRFPEAKEILKRLKNPPAIRYMPSEPPVIPDLFVVFENNEFIIRMNNAFYPDLKVIQVDKYENFAKKKFKEARELVKLLDLRKSTLYNITLVLLEKQYEFFMGGTLNPLKLLDVAEELGFNESTISRAINGKYLETEKGVYALKDFFSNAIGNVSTAEIKEFIRRLVQSEERQKPYSDKYLHEKIEERFGIQMVRRSVAKYRQEMDIPSFKERKFLYQLEIL